MQQQIEFQDLGLRRYQEVWDYQESLLKDNATIKATCRQSAETILPQMVPTQHHLLFLEHNPVYTLGKSGKYEHLLINEKDCAARGIEYFHINRGGDITFHGPGQLVGYPILDLEKFKPDLGWFLRSLEEVIILTLAEYGLKADRSLGETGVWLDPQIPGKERKICAMGIKCSRWITMHGFAININTDLNYFNFILPCGIQNKQVTSLAKELGREISMDEVKYKVKKNFEIVFDCAFNNH
ncbi:MAG: lipoyl(octanoyl) transferase LipB [Bacteroidetes bacterium]|nr:lipoyl(octanoyl) transferase LipB [Bacteroidota bacterium]